MKENNTELIVQSLEKQLNQRLEKLWKIFSWTSSILVSITGGIIVLSRTQGLVLHIYDRLLLSLVILVISLYAFLWLKENLRFEGKIRDQLDKIFSQDLKYPLINEIRPDRAKFGYKAVVILLGISALLATWLDHLI